MSKSLRALTEDLKKFVKGMAVDTVKDAAKAVYHGTAARTHMLRAGGRALTGNFKAAKKEVGAAMDSHKKFLGPGVRTAANFIPGGAVAGKAGGVAARVAAKAGASAATQKVVGSAASAAAKVGMEKAKKFRTRDE